MTTKGKDNSPKQAGREFFAEIPLDVDILWHRMRYGKSPFSVFMRRTIKKAPGLKTGWHYLYYIGRRRKLMQSLAPVPRKLKLELTNACNLRCIMCPNSQSKRKRGMMEWDLFERIVREAKKIGVPHIGMYSTGESMLHPRFCEMVSYAKRQGLYVSVCTNAQLLTEERSRELIHAGLDMMRCSIEGSTAARYESVRRGGKFDRLVSNIRYFKKLRDERRASTVIWIDSVYFGEGFEEARRFRELFAPYADGIFFYPVCNMAGANFLGGASPQSNETWQKKVKPAPCINLWATMCVTWDGKATLCNYDFEAETAVGDLNTSSLVQLWRSEKYNRFRRLHVMGKQEEMPLCGGCSDIYSQPNALFKPFLANEKVIRPCLKTSFEAFYLNDRIERYCKRSAP
jgi:MoaA/NifB/PqqE/SkfB family radical SAM enzyme